MSVEYIVIDRESIKSGDWLPDEEVAERCEVRLTQGGSVTFQAKPDARGQLTYHIHPSGALYVRIGSYTLRVFGPTAWLTILEGSESFAAESEY